MIASKTIYTDNSLPDDLEKYTKSILMQDILHKVLRLAKLDSSVVLVGEMGAGKKRLAKIIHENSARALGPFYSFYCVDIGENEYKEAFWGQLQLEDNCVTLKYDALEKASGGTLFLDQFSELSLNYMSNIIDSYLKGCRQLFRLDKTAKPRLIISLNQEYYHQILNTPIWEKLLNQLDPFVIMLPPLRERKEDIPLLINHFLKEIKETNADYNNLNISASALYDCFNYSWPGNVRQLKNAILQGAILSYGQTIESRHLPFSMSWKLPYEID